MKYLYYTRHGESLINTKDVWADEPGGAYDWGLSPHGNAQALAGAHAAATAGIKPDLIICSPLLRTRETAAIIAKTLGYDPAAIEYDARFVEVQVGELEGSSYAEFVQQYSYADLGKFKDAETIEVLQERAAKAFNYLLSRPEETIFVVSHSCFGRAFKRAIESKPYTDEFVQNDKLPYGEINLVYTAP